MSITETTRRAGPYATDGAQTEFAFAFKVFDEEDVVVTSSEDAVDTELTLTTDYTVTLNADQDSAPGGTVTLVVAPDGPTVTITSDMAATQPTVFTSAGGFFPRVLNNALDRVTILVQQLIEKLTRVPLLPLGDAPVGEFPVVLADGSFGWSTGTGSDAALRSDLALATVGKGADLIGVSQTGVGAEARAVGAKLKDIPTPYDFDISEDNDSTTGMQQWLDACQAEGLAPHSSRKLIIPVSDTIEMGVPALATDFTGLFLSNLTLLYSGTRDRPVFKIDGTSGGGNVTNETPELWLPRVKAVGAVSWPGALIPGTALADDTGILLNAIHHATIRVPSVVGFTKGYELRNSSYNTVHVGHLSDCKYAEVLSTLGAIVALEFTNENVFFGGKRGSTSSAPASNAYGTVFCWDEVSSYRGLNNNRWYSPCYEMGTAATYRVPIWLKGVGANNVWDAIRLESNKGPIAIMDGGGSNFAYSNTIGVSFNNSSGSDQIDSILQVNDAAGNIYTGIRAKEARWQSGDLKKLLSSNGGANSPYLRGDVFLMDTTASTPVRTTTIAARVVTNAKALQLNGAAVLTAVDTTKIKTFRVFAATLSGFGGRPIIIAFNAAGTRLTADAVDATWGNEPYVKRPGGEIIAAGGYGGSYSGNNSDGVTDLTFTVRSEVAKIYVGWASGTNPLAIQSFEVVGYIEPEIAAGTSAEVGMRVWADLADDGSQRLATAKPDTAGTHGEYAKGQKVYSAAVAAAATDGWPCSTAGYLAAAWAINTVYAVPGHVVTNDGGKMYELVTAGTSAGAGGPTGTGSGIADNTCVWNYIGVKAVFVTSAVTS